MQQMLEKIVPLSRVEVFLDKQEAIVELKTPAVCPVPPLFWYHTEDFSNRTLDGCC